MLLSFQFKYINFINTFKQKNIQFEIMLTAVYPKYTGQNLAFFQNLQMLKIVT